MHDIRFIRENPDAFDAGLARRGLQGKATRLDRARRRCAARRSRSSKTAQARRNAASKEIGEAKKNKDEAKAKSLMAEVAELKETIPAMEVEEKSASKALDDALAQIPNLPLPKCPTARAPTTMSSIIASARGATTRSRRSSISISAKRSARWISRLPQSFPVHALSC